MRILQLCSASSIGGGERHVVDLSNSLAASGHEILFVVRPGSPMRPLLNRFPDENFFFAKMRNAFDVASAFHISKFAQTNNADIIHAHLARDYNIAAIASRFASVPFVLTRHVLFPMKRANKVALKNVSAVIAPSTAVFDALRNAGVFPAGKIFLIHNGIDLIRFSGLKAKPHERFTVGSIGHLGPIKGHDTLVRAAAIVAKQRPDIRFVIIGEDKSPDGRYHHTLTKLIAELDLEKQVELLGWTDDVRQPLADMDIFVSAARSEPFGLAITEAMASNLPVIATRSEGASEIIVDGVSGVLVGLDDPQAMATAILGLVADPGLRERLAASGRKRVVENFSLEQMAEKTEVLFRKIIEPTDVVRS